MDVSTNSGWWSPATSIHASSVVVAGVSENIKTLRGVTRERRPVNCETGGVSGIGPEGHSTGATLPQDATLYQDATLPRDATPPRMPHCHGRAGTRDRSRGRQAVLGRDERYQYEKMATTRTSPDTTYVTGPQSMAL